MKTLTTLLFIISFSAVGQDSTRVGEIKYQYKNDAFPFDSGIAISDRQYQFIQRNQAYVKIEEKTTIQPPKIVIQTKEVRKKGDGNKFTWSLLGVVVGVIVTTLIAKI